MKYSAIKDWINDHKKELIIAGITIVVIAGTVYILRHVPKRAISKAGKVIEPIIQDTVAPDIPSNISDLLTGNRLTPTKLGNLVMESPQAINKRLVENGFQIRYPSGGYQMTEAGKKFGKEVLKSTRWDYVFSNIEWDERIMDYIFDAEELERRRRDAEKAVALREEVRKILETA